MPLSEQIYAQKFQVVKDRLQTPLEDVTSDTLASTQTLLITNRGLVRILYTGGGYV